MADLNRPLFADVGRARNGGASERSSAMMLVIVLGLLAACAAFAWEQLSISNLRAVEVQWMPAEAAAAEQQVDALRRASLPASPAGLPPDPAPPPDSKPASP